MAGELTWLIVAVVIEGKEKQFEELAHHAVSWTKGNEPGVSEYAWRYSKDTGAVAILVRTTSAEAARAYLGNFERRFLVHFAECLEIQHTLAFGHVPEPIRKKLETYSPVYMPDIAAFQRTSAGGPSLMS